LLIVELLFSIVLTGFGSIGLVRQLGELRWARVSRRWPTADATVVSSAVHERRGSRGRRVFEVTVEYEYNWRSIGHVGQRITFGDVATANRPDAHKLAERFAVGTRWQVHVCAQQPQLSVLDPGPTRRLWFSVLFFTVYTLSATAFLVDSLQRWRFAAGG
jgi:hypothetical protein